MVKKSWRILRFKYWSSDLEVQIFKFRFWGSNIQVQILKVSFWRWIIGVMYFRIWLLKLHTENSHMTRFIKIWHSKSDPGNWAIFFKRTFYPQNLTLTIRPLILTLILRSSKSILQRSICKIWPSESDYQKWYSW